MQKPNQQDIVTILKFMKRNTAEVPAVIDIQDIQDALKLDDDRLQSLMEALTAQGLVDDSWGLRGYALTPAGFKLASTL